MTESEMRNTKKINMDRKTLGVPVGRNIYTTESSTAAQKLRFAPDCFADCNFSVPWTGTMFFDGSASPVRNAQKKKGKINQKYFGVSASMVTDKTKLVWQPEKCTPKLYFGQL